LFLVSAFNGAIAPQLRTIVYVPSHSTPCYPRCGDNRHNRFHISHRVSTLFRFAFTVGRDLLIALCTIEQIAEEHLITIVA
jgi:hypothetical protein